MAGDFTGKVYENFCYKAGEGITCQNGPGLQMSADIYNNVIAYIEFHASNAQGPGINIFNGGGARVFNNTIAFSNYGASILNTPNTPIFKNNIFYENKTQIVTWRPKLEMDNNLYFSTTGNKFVSKVTDAGFSGDLNEWRRRYGELNSKVADPKLVGRGFTALDYMISSGSAAVDMGTATGAPLVDYSGQRRPSGARHDVGAFELGPPTVTKPTPRAPGSFVVN